MIIKIEPAGSFHVSRWSIRSPIMLISQMAGTASTIIQQI